MLGRVNKEKNVIEYFNEVGEDRNLFLNIKNEYFNRDKLKRKMDILSEMKRVLKTTINNHFSLQGSNNSLNSKGKKIF